MKTLLVLACIAIGIFFGHSMGGGFGGVGIGAAVGGFVTLIFMAAGGGVGLAVGAVIALIFRTSEREASALQDSSDPE